MPGQLALFCILVCCFPAYAQFQLYVVSGNAETPAPPVHNLGSVYQNEVATARYRLRNVSPSPAIIYVLAADGTGFALTGAPPLPATVAGRATLDFAVTFSSASLGTFSATLRSEGLSTLITATVVPRLTYTVEGQPLGADAIDFGRIERGREAVRRFSIENASPLVLTVPSIVVRGGAFAIGAVPSGQVLEPRQVAQFDVRFVPATAGVHTGLLTIGDRSYSLRGAADEPPLPKPFLSIDLPQARSGQQGTLAVRLDQASRTTGTGTVTLEFRPMTPGAADPGIAFATGGLTVPFEVSLGDTQPLTVPFQTGTTAGSLIFSVTLGGSIDRQTVTFPPDAVAISSASAARSAKAIEVRIAAFDNTRTIGHAAYTFFDAAGAMIQPGTIYVDSTADFARFFPTSGAGGNFVLRAVFPVTGDASRVAGCEVELTNSAGTARSARITF